MNDLPRPSPLAADPYWSNVVLLCHCDGTNGSTTFTDVSGRNHTFTQSASPVTVDTTSPKFGTGSGKFVAANTQQLTVTDNFADFNLQGTTWTIDLWVNATATISGIMSSDTSTGGWGFFLNGSYLPNFLWYDVVAGGWKTISSAATIPGWHMLSAERTAGGTIYFYIDGAIIGSYAGGNVNMSGVTALQIGREPSFMGSYFDGHIDEFRITKGVARYGGAAFTPPSTAFPDATTVAAVRNTTFVATRRRRGQLIVPHRRSIILHKPNEG